MNAARADELFGSDDDNVDEEEQFEQACMRDTSAMTEHTRARLLAGRDPKRGVLDFRGGSEEALLLYVARHAQPTPSSVLRCCDVFCYARQWMMHSGDKKRALLERAVATARTAQAGNEQTPQPLRVLELGPLKRMRLPL